MPLTPDGQDCDQGVLDFIGARMGLCFPPNRLSHAQAAIDRGMAQAGVADPSRYCDLLRSNSRAFDDLVAELTVGETYFFREPAHFDFVRETVLPDLTRRAGGQRPIRVWSAGCATGEEAYSLAILFAEAGLSGQTRILATDISRVALAKAYEAMYRDWSLRGDGVARTHAWLRRQGDSHLLDEGIRRQVVFEYLNLAVDVYPSFANGTWGMDLIFCRNVLIYFDRVTVKRVAARFCQSLAPGGWLVTASSDPPLNELAPLEAVVSDRAVLYRRSLDPDRPLEIQDHGERCPEPPPIPPAMISAPRTGDSPPGRGSSERGSSERGRAQSTASHAGIPRKVEQDGGGHDDPEASVRQIHLLANSDSLAAERLCGAALSRHPLSAVLHHLHAVLLQELDQTVAAVEAARRAIYLDRSLAIAHFTLGVVLQRQGDRAGAKRAYRNVRDLCLARPADEEVPLADGEQAGRLAEAAAAQTAILEAASDISQSNRG